MTRRIKIGNTAIGGGEPVAIQSMLNCHFLDIEGNAAQAALLERIGCDINRVSVPNEAAVALIPAIKAATAIPLVADIHFDYRLAIRSAEAGADKIRFNPGNIGDDDKVRRVVDCCRANGVPIRVGVNAGSLEREMLKKHGGPTGGALFESAMRHVRLIEKSGYENIVISMKSSDVRVMADAYRRASAAVDYPLHLGVTEAGTLRTGTVKSAVGIGSLLLDGIGDTVRVSLTDSPEREIEAADAILRAVGMRGGVEVISCPTCGRTEIDIIGTAAEVERRTRGMKKNLKVAIMGCVVNGPGEAAHADIGIAGGRECAVLFRHGEVVRTVYGDYTEALMREIEGSR